MTRADNTHHLLRAAAQRHHQAITRARAAIDALDRSAQAVSFSAVANAAGVSRGWLYRQDELRDTIVRLRNRASTVPHVPSAQQASTASLRQRLDSQKDEIAALRAANADLRDHLARRLGEERTRP